MFIFIPLVTSHTLHDINIIPMIWKSTFVYFAFLTLDHFFDSKSHFWWGLFDKIQKLKANWIRWKLEVRFRYSEKKLRCVHNYYLMHHLKHKRQRITSIRWRSNLCLSSWSMTSVFIRADAAPIGISLPFLTTMVHSLSFLNIASAFRLTYRICRNYVSSLNVEFFVMNWFLKN